MALFTACSPSLSVNSDYDRSYDFTNISTYSYMGWADHSDRILNRFDKERIESAFAKQFSARNLKYVESGGDVTVSLFIVVDEKTSVTAYTDHYGMGGYGYGYGWGYGMGTSTTRYQEYDYLVGTLVVDIFDTENKELVWQAVGSRTVDDNPNSEIKQQKVDYAAERIMSSFPVKPVKKK